MNNSKKAAILIGGAIATGAVVFFVYSFFKKPDETETDVPQKVGGDQKSNSVWSDYFAGLQKTFPAINVPLTADGFNATLWETVKN